MRKGRKEDDNGLGKKRAVNTIITFPNLPSIQQGEKGNNICT